jgi:tetrahydromethanopterin S-methyltransferase subunit C
MSLILFGWAIFALILSCVWIANAKRIAASGGDGSGSPAMVVITGAIGLAASAFAFVEAFKPPP